MIRKVAWARNDWVSGFKSSNKAQTLKFETDSSGLRTNHVFLDAACLHRQPWHVTWAMRWLIANHKPCPQVVKTFPSIVIHLNEMPVEKRVCFTKLSQVILSSEQWLRHAKFLLIPLWLGILHSLSQPKSMLLGVCCAMPFDYLFLTRDRQQNDQRKDQGSYWRKTWL